MALITKAEFSKKMGWAQSRTSRNISDGIIIPVDGMVDEDQAVRAVEVSSDPDRPTPKKDKRRFNGAKRKVSNLQKPTYIEAKTDREYWRAQITKLEYEREVGDLVNASEVRNTAFKFARMMRDAILSIPDRMTAVLMEHTGKGADQKKIHEVLRQESQKVLEDFEKEYADKYQA